MAGEARNKGVSVQRSSTSNAFKGRLNVRSRQSICKAKVKIIEEQWKYWKMKTLQMCG